MKAIKIIRNTITIENRLMRTKVIILRRWYFNSEYLMIYRGPGFLAAVWFGSSLTPGQQLVSLSQSSGVFPVQLTAGRGGKGVGGGGGAQSYGREKAWPSRNHSILSALQPVEWRLYTFYSRYHCSFKTIFMGNIKGKLHFYSKRRIAKQLCIFAAAFFLSLCGGESAGIGEPEMHL